MTPKPLITAKEIFPALERMVAAAEEEVFLSFRILDPDTRLRARELTERGLETWADLLAWLSAKGISIRLILTDFDPLFAESLHRGAWASGSKFADRLEGDTQILVAPHAQEVGWLWRSILWRKIAQKLQGLRNQEAEKLTPVQRAFLKLRPKLRPVSIHQKVAVVDNRHCIIGGLDVNERRWDTNAHRGEGDKTWHDVSVEIEGDFAEQARAHLVETWNASLEYGAADVGTKAMPMKVGPRPQGTSDLRLVRTVSAPLRGPFAFGPHPRHPEHEKTLKHAFGSAKRHIYLETQFLRHRPLVRALIDAKKARPELQLVILLPTEPERVLYDGDRSLNARHAHALQTNALNDLVKAYGDDVAVVAPAQKIATDAEPPESLHGAAPIYVHAKVVIIDGDFGLVGSANLNGRSLRWDTEASILFRDKAVVRDLHERLAKKWLGPMGEDRDISDARVWNEIAKSNRKLEPTERSGFVLPYPLGRARRFARYLPLLPADMF
ncbi:phosphatidylserine/phosphatidylglycerophosphate/cardiolipin synthase family protein [Roseivivax sp. THAF30]|uniref:phospholipase D-like domain-containing protein n=1 Tax=Roseivivax sp. THAF30 TaxID=2587852 RepID=UPI001268D03A|nr:phospholipase D family protein [Roseivivax sp. THAF30]QFT64168.1 cardiolipin synthetase [Roseivivax sp. THAF30]